MYLGWELCVEDCLGAGICDYFYILAFLHELDACNLVGWDIDLLKGLVVHEHVVLTLSIEVLIGTALYANVFELLADIESLLDYTAIDYVLEGNVHDSVAFAWFAMEEIDAEIQLAIHANAYAFLDVL